MNETSDEKRILLVGLCCLDVCNYVEKYPAEDTDNRVFEQRSCLGGNVSNSMSVIKQLNDYSEMLAALPENDPIIENELLKNPINTSKCIRRPNFEIPITTIIISLDNGSRTIFHYRGNLVEPQFEEFRVKITKPEEYSWIHFEGRNTTEVKKMLEYVYERRKNLNFTRPKISIELEKIRPPPWLEQLIPYADVIFMSKDYARSKGWNTKIEAVNKLFYEVCTHKPLVICPWADEGCAVIDNISEELISIEGYHPEKVTDTLAAGDCFIAASIHFLNQGLAIVESLELATKIAGIKVGQKGLMNLPLDFLKN